MTVFSWRGGCAALKGITEHFDPQTHCPVFTIDPFLGMTISLKANRANLAQDAPKLLAATGLALRSFE